MGLVQFIAEACKHPREVSTIFPSSRFLAMAMADEVDFQCSDVIVELGAGDGALTQPLVDRLQSDTQLLLVEVNEQFCESLREKYRDHEKWNQIQVLQREAQNLDQICEDLGIDSVDAIVSGLPLTSLPDSLSNEILDVTHDVLSPGGIYVQFTYWTMTFFNDFKDDIRPVFGKPRRTNVLLNLLPAVVYSVEKDSSTRESFREILFEEGYAT